MAAQPPYDLVIRNADLLHVASGTAEHLRGQDIAIAGGKIAAIGQELSVAAAEEFDATGLLATAGMVNCHSHVAMGLLRGVAEDVSVQDWFNKFVWPMETGLTPEDVYWGSLLGIAEMIAAGVTSFADHYFMTEAVARAVEESGIRAVLAPTVFSGETEAADLDAAAAFASEWNGAAGGRITTMLGPHAPYTCTPDFLRKVAARAKELGLGVHIHLSETAEQVRLSREQHGLTPVALLQELGFGEIPTLLAHMAHPEGDDLAILAAGNYTVGACPKTEMKLGSGVTPVVAMRAAGIVVGLGSDGAASNDSYGILDAAQLMALLEKHERRDPTVLPVAETLALATSEGAQAIGLGATTGRLEPGFAADIVLRRIGGAHGTPVHDAAATLLYSAHPGDVETVLIDGRIVYRDYRHLTLDLGRVLEEAGSRARRLAAGAYEQRMAFYPA